MQGLSYTAMVEVLIIWYSASEVTPPQLKGRRANRLLPWALLTHPISHIHIGWLTPGAKHGSTKSEHTLVLGDQSKGEPLPQQSSAFLTLLVGKYIELEKKKTTKKTKNKNRSLKSHFCPFPNQDQFFVLT